MSKKNVERIISIEEFRQMMAYRDIVDTVGEQQKLKLKLYGRIREAYGDRWYHLSPGAKKVIDYLCWHSVDKGFCFKDPRNIARDEGVSKSTVYNIMKRLAEMDKIIILNRTSTRHTGRGKRVIMFVEHPYFKYWVEFLDLSWNPGWKANWKAMNPENARETGDSGRETVSTNDLPSESTKVSYSTTKGKVNSRDSSVVDVKESIYQNLIPAEFYALYQEFQFKRPALFVYRLYKNTKKILQSLQKRMEDSYEVIRSALSVLREKIENHEVRECEIKTYGGILYNLCTYRTTKRRHKPLPSWIERQLDDERKERQRPEKKADPSLGHREIDVLETLFEMERDLSNISGILTVYDQLQAVIDKYHFHHDRRALNLQQDIQKFLMQHRSIS